MIASGFLAPFSLKYQNTRARSMVIGDDLSREALNPTNAVAMYTKTAVGTDTSAMSTTINRYQLITDVNAADNVDIKTANLRLDRAYPSQYSGMYDLEQNLATGTLTILMPFVCSSGASNEGFVGMIGNSSALAAPPTTARHIGVYWDLSANGDYQLSSADGTTQSTTDTNDTVDTNRKILRITWTSESDATAELLSGAGALSTATSLHTVAALSGTAEISYELHWFVETETTAAKQLNMYGWRAKWTA